MLAPLVLPSLILLSSVSVFDPSPNPFHVVMIPLLLQAHFSGKETSPPSDDPTPISNIPLHHRLLLPAFYPLWTRLHQIAGVPSSLKKDPGPKCHRSMFSTDAAEPTDLNN